MAQLGLSNVTKTYEDGADEIVAVDDLSLDIQDGEFVVLVGPSGCGKSTTLRMIAGLEIPTSGEITLGGNSITNQPPQDRDISMVFQSYALYPHMTVRGNMSFALKEEGRLSADEIKTKVKETAAMLGIEDLLDRKPQELSGGQQQRVALGRSIVRDPAAFLMDEPLSNLDAKLRAEMRTELQNLQEELETTTIYVTHDQTEAMTMGDRIAVLDGGQLQQIGTPLECYHAPENLFVASFLGEPSMNFFEGSVQGQNIVTDSLSYPISNELTTTVEDRSEVTIGIRPEDIELLDGSGLDDEFKAIIDIVEPQGDENTVHLRFEGDADGTNKFIASISGMQLPDQGNTTTVRLPQDAVHLFDTRTGEALHNRILRDSGAKEIVNSSVE